MSSLVAIFNRDHRPVQPELLERMIERSAYRGNDERACYSSGYIGLAHQAFRTTPESLQEHQPVRDEQSNIFLLLDGRIDNADDLRAVLNSAGQLVRDHTDADLVLRAYQFWGKECAERLIGDFAVIVWDHTKQSLICMRDYLGMKPLFYYSSERTVVVSSDFAALLSHPDVPCAPNLTAVAEYLADTLQLDTDTLYQGIHRILPGHYASFTATSLQVHASWKPERIKDIRYSKDEDYSEHLLALLKDAVRCRMRSVGPVAIELSGGVDSSSVLGVAKLLRDEGQVSSEIRVFSQVYPGRSCDETPYIDAVTSHLNLASTRVTPCCPSIEWYRELARTYQYFPGFPNGSAPSLEFHSAMLQSGCRVVLTGRGGDEWFGGSVYAGASLLHAGRMRDFLYHLKQSAAAGTAMRSLHGAIAEAIWSARFAVTEYLPTSIRVARQKSRLANRLKSLLGPALHDAAFCRSAFSSRLAPSGMSLLGKDLYLRNTTSIEMHRNEGEERDASWLGLEKRHPLHDRRIAEFVLSIPYDQLVRKKLTKYVLRNALANHLPAMVLGRRDKADFWWLFLETFGLSGGMEAFRRLTIAELDWVDERQLRSMLLQFQHMCKSGTAEYTNINWRLWAVLGIEAWYDSAILNPIL